jgi:hypothetical protein
VLGDPRADTALCWAVQTLHTSYHFDDPDHYDAFWNLRFLGFSP